MNPLRWIVLAAGIWLISVSLFAQSVESLVKEGIAYHDQGEFNKAIEKYKEALLISPVSWSVHYELAYSYHALKEYDNAIASADQAIKYSNGQDKLYPYIIKGSALDDMGKTGESVKFYKMALQEFPEEYLLLYNYAVSCSRSGNLSNAEAALLKGLSFNSTHPSSHLQLAMIKLDHNQKVFGALGMYFFLMIENNTERSKVQVRRLKELMYGSKEQVNSKTILLTMPNDNDAQTASAELFFSILGMASNEIDKTTSGDSVRSEQRKFVDDTGKLFTTLKELSEKRRPPSGKKKKVGRENFWWDFYVPFFSALHDSGHTEAFCYHIMQSSGDAEVLDWLNLNKEKLEFFYLWVNRK